jgi:hypothetical protein
MRRETFLKIILIRIIIDFRDGNLCMIVVGTCSEQQRKMREAR